MTAHAIVSKEQWTEARLSLLAEEKAMTRERDRLAEKRRALPWVTVDKAYLFDTSSGTMTLADLFRGRSQLFVKHFMMAPGQSEQCVGCSLEVDHVAGILEHIEHHDISYVVVARAPLAEIEAVRQRMGWRFFWASSFGSDFNYDFDVSFTAEQMASGEAVYNYRPRRGGMEDLSGNSVFFKDEAGQIFHTYSSFGRGGEDMLGIYAYLDKTPKGREENGPFHSLPDWARPRTKYGQGGSVEGDGRYRPAPCGCSPKPEPMSDHRTGGEIP